MSDKYSPPIEQPATHPEARVSPVVASQSHSVAWQPFCQGLCSPLGLQLPLNFWHPTHPTSLQELHFPPVKEFDNALSASPTEEETPSYKSTH